MEQTNLDESIGTPPVVVGQRIVVKISDLAFGGEGVARVDDFVIFVPFVALGEQVEVECVEVKKRFARARLVRVVEPAPERVTPPCKYFGDCGGCQYQHLEYSAQLRLKQKQIADLLQRLGGVEPSLVQPVLPCPVQYGYRNRIMVRSQWDKYKQALNVGFIRVDNRLVVDIEECKIAEPRLNEELKSVRAHPPPKGGLKVVLRLEAEGWQVPKDSFFQTNYHALPSLCDVVRQSIRQSGARFLVDAYCGVGFFGLSAADLVERFVGIEYDKRAIEAARRNAATRGIANGEFISGRTEDHLRNSLQQRSNTETTVVIDPPRAGAAPETLAALLEFGPAQILYVSCHPATLARDLKELSQNGGFRVEAIHPIDMFPQTQHVECVADLRRAV